QRPIQLPNACRVVDATVNEHALVAKPKRQRFQAALKQLLAGLVVGEVKAVEEMGAVAAIGGGRLWAALVLEPCGAICSSRQRRVMLSVRGGDTGRTCRIEVDRQPAPMEDVCVSGSVLRACNDTIHSPC